MGGQTGLAYTPTVHTTNERDCTSLTLQWQRKSVHRKWGLPANSDANWEIGEFCQCDQMRKQLVSIEMQLDFQHYQPNGFIPALQCQLKLIQIMKYVA